MRAYILGVCGAVIISALLFLLLPGGKLGKFIGGILKLFCVAVMLMPIPQLLRDFNLAADGEMKEGSVALDEEFISEMFGRQAEAQEEEIAAIFARDPGIGTQVEIGWQEDDYAYRVTEVSVQIEDFGIYGDDQHIFVIEQVKGRLNEMFGDAVEVSVYE